MAEAAKSLMDDEKLTQLSSEDVFFLFFLKVKVIERAGCHWGGIWMNLELIL